MEWNSGARMSEDVYQQWRAARERLIEAEREEARLRNAVCKSMGLEPILPETVTVTSLGKATWAAIDELTNIVAEVAKVDPDFLHDRLSEAASDAVRGDE
jgi:hypothetical protein